MPNSLFAIWHPAPVEEKSTSVCPGDHFDHGESVLEVQFIDGMQQVHAISIEGEDIGSSFVLDLHVVTVKIAEHLE